MNDTWQKSVYSCIYVHCNFSIKSPQDLKEKVVLNVTRKPNPNIAYGFLENVHNNDYLIASQFLIDCDWS